MKLLICTILIINDIQFLKTTIVICLNWSVHDEKEDSGSLNGPNFEIQTTKIKDFSRIDLDELVLQFTAHKKQFFGK